MREMYSTNKLISELNTSRLPSQNLEKYALGPITAKITSHLTQKEHCSSPIVREYSKIKFNIKQGDSIQILVVY